MSCDCTHFIDMPRKKKSSVNLRVTRPSIKDLPSTRAFSLHRLASGHLGSSTMHKKVPNPSKSTLLSNSSQNLALGEDLEYHDEIDVTESVDFGEGEDTAKDSSRPRGFARQKLLAQWLPHRQSYLDELNRLESPGENAAVCVICKAPGDYKCRDCCYPQHYCRECVVARHSHLPLHRILHWTSTFYKKTTLKDLGLCIQLGHDGPNCPSPGPIHFDFVVVDTSGVHVVNLRYCNCHSVIGASLDRVQLLRFQWFPATVLRPRTAFTFDVLDTFHIVTLQGKLAAFDFYRSLLYKTDNSGLHHLKVRVPISFYVLFSILPLGSLYTISIC